MVLPKFTRFIITSTYDCVKSIKLSPVVRNRLHCYGQIRGFTVAGVQEKIQVSNLTLNVEKVGEGPHKILCLPGTLGSIETDFAPQLQKLSKDKFTIVAWDPPGYGKSRPPNRDLTSTPLENFEKDAHLAHSLMNKLGYEKFSLIGWSGGAQTAIIMVSYFPESIQKMVLVAGQAFLNDQDAISSKMLRDIDSWSEKMKKPLVDLYGEEYLRKMWEAYISWHIEQSEVGLNLCKDKLETVKCQTLLIHGAKDIVVNKDHSEYLHKYIKNSKLYIMPKGNHNLHLRYSDEFNAIVESFLSED